MIRQLNQSIKSQITVVFVLLLFLTFFVCWGINNVFLVKYYTSSKHDALEKVYNKIDIMFNQNLDDEVFRERRPDIEIKSFAEKENMSIIVAEEITQNVPFHYRGDTEFLKSQLQGYIFDKLDAKDAEAFARSETPYIIRQVTDSSFADMEYLELLGIIEAYNYRYYIIIHTSTESILESVDISNRFLSYIGCITVVFGAFIIGFLSKRLTNPISELVDISEKMTNLEFEAKYTSGGKNELGTLGRNINQLSETLEQTISELKTANNELQLDNERKTQIDEMRTEFLGHVSHELKTPISLIQGYAEGLKEGIADDKESRDFYCEVIMDEANKMNKMVKNLLSLNDLESEKTINMERFDIVELINGILLANKIIIEQKEAKIVFEAGEPVFVWADEFKVEEVVTNYVSNALNHLDGERIIEVRVIPQGTSVRVFVFNTGTPIPREDLDKVWGKFYKVDKARTREYGGNGIGLSIVKAIMDSFQKPCGVTNYANGVEFWFELDCKL